MPKTLLSPDRLFERPWRTGHPFRPRLSRTRRWGMTCVFLLLLALIGGYWYITDSDRVRAMAEQYLSRVLGGPVQVGRATLSLFEGMRLDDVKVRVDESDSPDAVIFSAHSFVIKADLQAILAGRLEASQIVAIDPHVRLTENLDTTPHRWNYQRMVREQRATQPTSASGSGKPLILPEILLRNAQIDYSEIRDGRHIPRGAMAIEGRLSPGNEPGRYTFDLQSRGQHEGTGPSLNGSLLIGGGRISAHLRNFSFGADIRGMLPAEVRQWWEQHELAGRIDDLLVTYDPPARKGEKARFSVETQFNSVTLRVHPREWMSRRETEQLRVTREGFELMRRFGLNGGQMVDRLDDLVRPEPIQVEGVSGAFAFTEEGIEIRNVTGRIETNGFKISGRIGGYSPDAPAELRLASLETQDIYVPHSPRYLNALPPEVREIYDHIHPVGTCSLWVHLKRSTAGARVEVQGELKIIQGQFSVDYFPYPLRNVTGRISFGWDPKRQSDWITLHEIRGYGVPGGPNENSNITVNGFIGPLGPESEFYIEVAGQNIASEPALRAAFPHEVRKALRIFGPTDLAQRRERSGSESDSDDLLKLPEEVLDEYPKYHGDFLCKVHRPFGIKKKFGFEVDLFLDDANGALTFFPYPLEHVSGHLKITGQWVRIVQMAMRRGDASLDISGQINFGRNQPVEPKVNIRAQNVPVDEALIAAVPREQRRWLRKLGVGGRLDVEGAIQRGLGVEPGSDGPEVGFDLTMKLREGLVWPIDGQYAASDVSGSFRLWPQRLEVSELKGKRGQAELSLRGLFSWPQNNPQTVLTATARNLTLDPTLYRLLPEAAQGGWDEVRPEGVVDVDVSYSGRAAVRRAATGQTPTNPADTRSSSSPAGYSVTIRPRKLSATLRSLPYRLDDLTGSLTVTPDRVLLQDIVGRHGAATVAVAGTGYLSGRPTWDVRLRGQNVTADSQFRDALPEALASLLENLDAEGKIDFAFPKLTYRPPEGSGTFRPGLGAGAATRRAARPRATPATGSASTRRAARAQARAQPRPLGAPQEPGADLDFTANVTLRPMKLDVGVPMTEVNGGLNLSGSVRNGRLADLNGTVSADSLRLADRPAKNFRAELYKPADLDALRIGKIQTELAGGTVAGEVNLAFPEDDASRFRLDLVLHNADVRQLVQAEQDSATQGQLSASLALEGDWADPRSRRGRGDVLISGKQILQVPVIVGLLQVANLSLPFTTPFNEAAARYSVEGNRVTCEQLEMRSNSLLVQGSGTLDFDTRKVNMTFVTDTPIGLKVPFLSDLVQGVKQELLQIHVRGTIQEPKMAAGVMNTFQTTVDEVFRGDGGEARRK